MNQGWKCLLQTKNNNVFLGGGNLSVFLFFLLLLVMGSNYDIIWVIILIWQEKQDIVKF